MDWHSWLIDRNTHREPVDKHFASALTWLRSTPPAVYSPILELGPGPQPDMTNVLRLEGRDVWTADPIMPTWATTPKDIGVADWSNTLTLPFESQQFGTILAREVLEHVAELPDMLQELRRILMPGGRLWFSTVFVFPYHDYPADYWRISDTGWEMLLRAAGFRKYKVWGERFLFGSWQLPCNVLGWAES